MHPFGGIPICPKCSKQVYAAEQVMGPGRKLYHKPCLACTLCNKRLDSFTLLEHDQLPYCKSCHIKNFGTRDLRHANLPHRDDAPSSPTRAGQPPPPLPPRVTSPTRVDPPAPLLKPTRSLATSPTSIRSPTFSRSSTNANDKDGEGDVAILSAEGRASPSAPPRALSPPGKFGILTNSGRHGQGNFPRTVALSPTKSTQPGTDPNPNLPPPPVPRPLHNSSRSVESIPLVSALAPTATGTRYGALLNPTNVNLTGNSDGSPRRWGTDTPTCPRCSRRVYFAEQVKAVGKTYHKGCLRCMECKTLLDSSRLRDHDGEPYCVRCYGKLHGPQGSGYALLGKAGG